MDAALGKISSSWVTLNKSHKEADPPSEEDQQPGASMSSVWWMVEGQKGRGPTVPVSAPTGPTGEMRSDLTMGLWDE